MTKKSNSFKNILTVLLALLLLGIAAGTASATVTNLVVTGGNANFYGDNVTVTWQSTSPNTWITIGSTGVSFNGTSDMNLTNDLTGATISNIYVGGVGSPFAFTYTFANYTVNQSAQDLSINISESSGTNAVATLAILMNSYNVTLQTGRSAAERNSTLAGDTIQVNVNTNGSGSAANRNGKSFTIAMPEGGNSVSAASNVAGTGNYTFNITTTQSGVGAFRNITLSDGVFSWNSTQMATYLGSTGVTVTQFNVSQINLRAYDIGTGSSSPNFTSANITSLLNGVTVPANPANAVNVTLTNSITSASTISFNSTTPGFVNNYTVNLTFQAGVGDAITWGNYTEPINASTVSVTTATSGTITAVTNRTGTTSWTSNYIIHPIGQLITISAPTASQAFVVGANITISGWSSNITAPVYINITGPAGVTNRSGSSGTSIEVWNTTVSPASIDGTFTTTWYTNDTWNSTNNFNVLSAPMGTYVIKANSSNSTVSSITQSVVFSEDLVVTTNKTNNVVSIDSPVLLNFTTNRLNNNGNTYWYNITSGLTVINNSQSIVVSNFNRITNTSSGNIAWTPSVNATQLASLGVSLNSANISTTLQVKDNATTTAATVYVTDYVTVNNAVGVAGNTINITGTTARANSSTAINISIYEMIGGVRGNFKLQNIAVAIVNNNEWYNNSVYLTSTGAAGGTALSAGTYEVEVNDTIVKGLGTITIGTGTITVDSQPTSYSYDGIAYITGSTNLPTGTIITLNITTAAGVVINNTISSIVSATQTFNATWPINQSQAALRGNFTKPSTLYIINATNSTYYGLGNITLSSDITVSPSRTSVVTGDSFNISGTSGRIAGTVLTINVTSGNFDSGTTATVSASGTFEITVYARNPVTSSSGTNLVNGAYSIKVNDSTGLQITNTSTFNIVNPSVTLVSPVSGTTLVNGSNISISGTSNRGASQTISLTITGVNYALSGAGITATTDANGNFTYSWNTTSDYNGNAAAPGTYSVTAVSGTVASNALSIVLQGPALVSLNVTPAGVTITADQTQQFTATGYDQAGNPTTITPAVVWSGSNSTVGTVNETTGLFTAIKVGTITITAMNGTNGTISGNTTINVIAGALSAITVTPAAPSLLVGANQTFTATGVDADGNAVDITPAWNSSNTTVGTINESTGLFAAVAEGTTIIEATNGTVNGTTIVTVTLTVTPSLTITATPETVTVGIPEDVTFNVTSNGIAVPNATVTLRLSVDYINATTDSNGLAVITVNATDEGPISVTAAKDGYTTTTITITAEEAVHGSDTVGIYRSGAFYLRNNNSAGNADLAFIYGISTDTPLKGDWNGDGSDTVGVYRNGSFYLRNSNSAGNANLSFMYGVDGDIPLVGDWNGDGVDTVGIYRHGAFYLKNNNSAGNADMSFIYGVDGDIPLVGDWNGDGVDTVGIYRNGAFYLRNSNSAGNADMSFIYGINGDTPLVGDWNSDGTDTVGIYRVGAFYLKNSNEAGNADLSFRYGIETDTPLVGNWDGQ